MSEENRISGNNWHVPIAKEMYNIAAQIAEFAENSTVLRSYTRKYGNLTDDIISFESDGAHVNLMSAMVDRAFSWYYGPSTLYTDDGYSYREIMEAIRRHDLPENVIGDIPDDGNRDEASKLLAEETYHQEFSAKSPSRELEFERKVHRLLEEIVGKTSPTGKLIYVADKVSAIIMTLFYDSIHHLCTRNKSYFSFDVLHREDNRFVSDETDFNLLSFLAWIESEFSVCISCSSINCLAVRILHYNVCSCNRAVVGTIYNCSCDCVLSPADKLA